MAMFKYNPVGGNESTTCFETYFKAGTPTKVEDPRAIGKLENNDEFEKVDGRTKDAKT